MPKTTIHISSDSGFLTEYLGPLGLLKYSDEIKERFLSQLNEVYGEDHLSEPGLTYHELLIYDRARFSFYLGIPDDDEEATHAWHELVRTAKATLVHQGIGNELEQDWDLQINICNAKPTKSLYVGVCVKVSPYGKVRDCYVYELDGVDYNNPEWTAFILKFQ